ncbi:MAG: hypothetical protein NC043_05295 [Muribaculaceae bacterium]|nr:hypothetical protein [Muribaculaceae bacterium]
MNFRTDTVLDTAMEAWCAGAELRARRDRYKRYTYGHQWNDPVTSPDGRVITEGELASESGRRPLTNNMIRQLIKCVTGNFRSRLHDSSLPMATPDSVPEEVAARNLLDELDCRMLEEFLISGSRLFHLEIK